MASIGDIWIFEKLYIPLFWVMLKIEINKFFYARFIQDKIHEIATREKGNYDRWFIDSSQRFYALV